MEIDNPIQKKAKLKKATLAFGALSLEKEKQPSDHSHSEAQLDSHGEDVVEETDPQQNEDSTEFANTKNGPSPKSPKTVPLPFTLFVYGPLADPFFLTYTMKMGHNPELTRSSISGYRMKFSKRYPAPIPAHGKTISEFSISIQYETQLRKITKWYSAAYKLVDCKIEVMRKEGQDYATSTRDWVPSRWVRDRVVDGKVFVWAGDVESVELEEGHWDEGCWAMERDEIMRIKKKTNTRELYGWEVKKKSRFAMWEDEIEEEKQQLRRAKEAKARKTGSRGGQERREGELGNLD